MAGILSFNSGATFIIRAYKSLGDPQRFRWANSYEIVALANGTITDLDTLAMRIVSFESELHAEAVLFDSYSVSTWVPDSAPYNPENLKVVPLELITGARSVAALVGLDLTLLLKRHAESGRNGKLFARGVLGEADVEREGAGWALTDPAGIQDEVEDALSSSSLGFHLLGGMASLKLAMIATYDGGQNVTIRPMLDISASGAVTLQIKRPWYNQPNRSLNAQAKRIVATRTLEERVADLRARAIAA